MAPTKSWLMFAVVFLCQQEPVQCQFADARLECQVLDPKPIPSDLSLPNTINSEDICVLSESNGPVFVRVLGVDRRKRNTNYDDILIETSRAYDITDPSQIAEPGVDYEHVSLPFPTERFDRWGFSIPIIRDNIVEGPELFQLNIYELVSPYEEDMNSRKRRYAAHPFDPDPIPGEYPCIYILIIDDDGDDDDVCFELAANIFVTNEDSLTVTYQILRTGSSSDSVAINVRTVDCTATGGVDFQTIDDSSYQLTQSVSDQSIVIYTDFKVEGPETFKIVISSSSEDVCIGQQSEAVVIVLDSEPTVATTGLFTFDMNQYTVTEGNDVTFQVCREGDSPSSTTITVQTTDGSAQSPSDYSSNTGTLQINFSNGDDKSTPITISTTEDTDVEQQETFGLALVSNGETISTASVWISDDDVRYCFESKSCVVSEGDGPVTLTIVKDGNLQDTTLLTLRATDLDATSPDDYTPINPSTIIVAVGTATTQINIQIEDDTVWEPMECFKVDILIGDEVVCSAIISIKDDDELCNPGCGDNGVCVGPNTCICLGDFTGEQCDQALCEPDCGDNGVCVGPNKCLCYDGFTGERCDQALCPQSCGIHGICDVRTNTCWCRSGYTGERCEQSICGCQNGGLCLDTGRCLCPPGFVGSRCQSVQGVFNGLPTSTVEGQFSVTTIDGVPAVFTPDLNVPGSPAREEMLRKILPLLDQFFEQVRDVLFSPGSVVVRFTATADSETTASDINNGLYNLIQSAPVISGLTIDPTSATTFTEGLSALCLQGYCRNGGTCTVDASGTGMTCMCANGYGGVQCDEQESNLSGGAIAGILLGVLGVILVAILIGICFCIYMRQTSNPQLQPNINTLDLATSPYTYPRLDAARGVNNLNTLGY